MTNRIVIILLANLIISLGLNAQTRVVYGKLTAFNQYPLKNIEVHARKTKSSVRSDSTGMFSIVCKESDNIRIKPKAFRPVSRKVTPETDTLHINLIFVDTKSNQDLATGYGYINERDLTYALSHLAHENNEFCNYNNIFELMQGRFAGVTVNVAQQAVYVRGVTSITTSNEALYVLDGMVIDDIGFVHPCEVKSIEILKDGMAAIYGSRGANGVVLIETKK
jgi:TonB-dependent SusC/RagA subfamily outer membrane receptor